MNKAEMIILGIVLFSFIISIYYYPQFPDEIPSHWNIEGEVDGYLPKFWGLFLFPSILAGLLLLFIGIPKIDPLKENIQKFRKHYEGFIIIILGFMFYIQMLTIMWTLGVRYDMGQVLSPALAALFFYAGILIENAEQNWFIGIRTPWTLSSRNVWRKTHDTGGKLFKVSGVAMLSGIVFPQYVFYVIFIPIILTVVYTFTYSYVEYQKEKKS